MTSQLRTRTARSLLAGAALAAAIAFSGLGVLASRLAAEKSPLTQCTDAAWAEYNECLMESDRWWHRKGCDLRFQANFALCWSTVVHQIVGS